MLLDETPAATWAGLAPRITVGRDSPDLERRVLALASDLIEGAVVVEVDGGHMAPVTRPSAVLPTWLAWLR
jgi:hypothetical protein